MDLGISCARGEPADKNCQNFGSPDKFITVDCSEVVLKVAALNCGGRGGAPGRSIGTDIEKPECHNIVDWS